MIDGDIENQVMNISAYVVEVYNFINVHSLKHALTSSVISGGKQLKAFYTYMINIYKYVQSHIMIYIQQDATLHSLFIYFWKTALHVSGGISTHHQEHIQLYLQHLAPVKL